MKTKSKGPNPMSIQEKREPLTSRSHKGWHPFGSAIILISIIVAILIAFWFAL